MSILRRIANLFHRSKLDEEIEAELRSHIEMRTADNMAAGMPSKEARRDALLRFGNRGVMKERVTEADAHMFLDTLWQDVRFAMRMLRKSPGFTAVAVLTLALGIGANTAIFSVVNAVLLEPLPFPHSETIVVLGGNAGIILGQLEKKSSDPVAWLKDVTSFEAAAAFQPGRINLSGIGKPESVRAAQVSPGFFHVLATEPVLGQDFPEPLNNAPTGAILSWRLWQSHFSGDTNIIGKLVTINAKPVAVLGVMPRGFQFPEGVDVWVPQGVGEDTIDRGVRYSYLIARLRPHTSLAQTKAEMEMITARVRASSTLFKSLGGPGILLTPLQESVTGNGNRTLLLVLLGAVGFVLLIACANVANLSLARASVRRREFAVRSALGAGRFRLVRQFLTEHLILALLGGGLGVLLAFWSTRSLVLAAMLPATLPDFNAIIINGPVLAFTVLVSLLAGIIFGLAPSIGSVKPELLHSLKGDSARLGGRERSKLRPTLLASQIAMSIVLLIGACLMIRTLIGLLSINPGFESSGVLTLNISLPNAKYKYAMQIIGYFDDALARLKGLSGVESVGAVNYLPLGGTPNFMMPVSSPGKPPDPAHLFANAASFFTVFGDYFQTLQVPLLRGRYFSRADGASATNVAIINEKLARHLWPNQNPIGRQFQADKIYTVVGEVGDVHHQSLQEASEMQFYVPESQSPTASMDIVIRTATGSALSAGAVRNAIAYLDKDQPVSQIRTMNEVLQDSISSQRSQMWLFTAFGTLAFVLAAIGCYGVVAYSVNQRTHEIGVRMALGAQRRDVLWLVIGQGARLAAIGIVIGIGASFGLTRLMASLLYGVTPTDPLTFIGVAILLLTVALVACYIPARRAMRVDPMSALRNE